MITLDRGQCINCLACIGVCPNYVLAISEDAGSDRRLELRYPEQCCACGHCIAVCPSGGLSHPELPTDQFVPLPPLAIASADMAALIHARRSIRHYEPRRVSDQTIDALMDAARHGGTSSNGQTEGFLMIKDREFLNQLEMLVVDVLWRAGFRHLGQDNPLACILRWIYGAELVRQYRAYHEIFSHRRAHGELRGVIFRNAPLVIVAHGLRRNVNGPANCALALRNIELLALTMGLGTCWIGFLAGAAAKSRKIGRMLGLERDRQVFGALMVGYPAEQYRVAMPRKEREVRWVPHLTDAATP
jgi:nitroreductase/NAD-dependent dihydropyrimidine dehydrogenase PreA subunit